MTVCFDIDIPKEKGAIDRVYLKRGGKLANVAMLADNQLAVTMTMSIKQAHDPFGHNNKDATRSAAKHLGVKFSAPRGLMPCE